MKIIDKTPLLDENGQLSFINRIQGMLKYGLNWPAELEAQQNVIAQLDRVLEKGFVLIRNFTLPGSEIVIPMILLGPGGVTVIHVTTSKGFFEAKGDQWNTVVNGRAQPASINLLNRATRFARAIQLYMERHRLDLAAPVEAVLITADPGAHVESLRPIARVVMSDAIKQFGTTLLQARPVWRSDFAYGLADRIIDPQAPREAASAVVPPAAQPASAPARAQAIFDASEQVKSFDPKDLGFAFADEASAGAESLHAEDGQPARPAAPLKKGKMLGMTTSQVVVLVVLLSCECLIVLGFAGLYLMNP